MSNNKTCGECKYFVTSNYLDVCVVECETRRADSVCNLCDEFKPKVITNGDVIRQMSNEELLNALKNLHKLLCWDKYKALAWLNAPAESEGE